MPEPLMPVGDVGLAVGRGESVAELIIELVESIRTTDEERRREQVKRSEAEPKFRARIFTGFPESVPIVPAQRGIGIHASVQFIRRQPANLAFKAGEASWPGYSWPGASF